MPAAYIRARGEPASLASPGYDAATVATPAPSQTRNFLLPISLVLAFGLYYSVRAPLWAVALAVLPLLALYALAPSWGARALAAFDREALALRARGSGEALRALFLRARVMRALAAPAAVAEREGMSLQLAGQARAAFEAYGRALQAWGAAPPLTLLLAYAHAAYDARAHAAAIGAYRRLHEESPGLPLVAWRLAHSLIRRAKSGDLDDAREVITSLSSAAEAPRVRALEALIEAKKGSAKKARAMLEALRSERAEQDAAELSGLAEEIDSALSHRKTAKKKKR